MPVEIPGLEWTNDPVVADPKADRAQRIEDLINISPDLDQAYEAVQQDKMAAKQSRQMSPKQGTEMEMNETIQLYNETTDPELKAMLKNEIFSMSTGTESDEAATVKGGEAKSNLGGPVNVTAVGQSEASKEVVDLLTGIPSFMEALKAGDVAGIAAAMATVIPFPGAKVGKAAEKVGEAVGVTADVIEPVVLEARRIAKELEDTPVGKGLEAANSTLKEKISSLEDSLGKLVPGWKDQQDALKKAQQEALELDKKADPLPYARAEKAAEGLAKEAQAFEKRVPELAKVRDMAKEYEPKIGALEERLMKLKEGLGPIDRDNYKEHEKLNKLREKLAFAKMPIYSAPRDIDQYGVMTKNRYKGALEAYTKDPKGGDKVQGKLKYLEDTKKVVDEAEKKALKAIEDIKEVEEALKPKGT